MFVVQKRDNKNSQWHTCSHNKKKCRYVDLGKGKSECIKRRESDKDKRPLRQYRILDTLTNSEVD